MGNRAAPYVRSGVSSMQIFQLLATYIAHLPLTLTHPPLIFNLPSFSNDGFCTYARPGSHIDSPCQAMTTVPLDLISLFLVPEIHFLAFVTQIPNFRLF